MITFKLNNHCYIARRENQHLICASNNFIHSIVHSNIENREREIIVGGWTTDSVYEFRNHRSFLHNPAGPALITTHEDCESVQKEVFYINGVIDRSREQQSYPEGDKLTEYEYPQNKSTK